MTQETNARTTFFRIVTAFAVIASLAVGAARASDNDPEKDLKKAAEKAEKEKEKAAKEERKRQEKIAKEEQERKEKGDKEEKGDKIAKDAKVPLVPAAPTISEKTGEPIRDYVVDFEKSYACSAQLFEVDEFTKHDYVACAKCASNILEAATCVSRLHEDRIRQYGNDYHHQLEALAKSAKRLLLAAQDHNRSEIFTCWADLKLQRDALALTPPWRP
jgi:hypothetical protein